MNQQGALFLAILFTILVGAFCIALFGKEKLVNVILWSLVGLIALAIAFGLVCLWLYGLGIIAV